MIDWKRAFSLGYEMQRTTNIQISWHDAIEEAMERFGDHEDMSQARVVRWLEQFPDEDLTLAVQVLRRVRYINTINIRTMTRQLFQIVNEELMRREYERVVFVAVGGDLGSGSGIVARVLRQVIRGTNYRLLSMLDISNLGPGEVDAIVFVDDFSGTGLTLKRWWENVEPIVRPTNASVFVGLLVLNDRAREVVESFCEVFAAEELDSSFDVFAPESKNFSQTDKAKLVEHCRRTECGPKYEKGFGQCGLLLAFKHGCPNNSLPILWYQNDKWRPLFNRRAI